MEKQRWEESERRRGEERRSKKRKPKKKEDAGARKGSRRKSRFDCVFSNDLLAPEGRKVDSLKRQVRSHVARCDMKNCTPLCPEAHFQVKMLQNTPTPNHFWKLNMSKKCTPFWRESTCPSQNVQKHLSVGPLLEVDMSKKCTPLWREAHFEVKSVKN